MIQCKDCEFFHVAENGEVSFSCDPFRNVKEPECLSKWQLLKVNQMVQAYQGMLRYYHKLGPIQEKMFKFVERELDDVDQAESWKYTDDEEENREDDGLEPLL